MRRPEIKDSQKWLDYISHPDVAKYVPDPCIPKSLEQAKTEMQWYNDLYNKKQGIAWSIVEQHSDDIIGTISIERWVEYHRRCEIAYDLNPEFWGQGIMHSAIKACVKIAFKKMQVVRIEAYTTLCNEKSIKLLEKSGFHHEATLKKHRWFKNQQIDVNLFVMLDDA